MGKEVPLSIPERLAIGCEIFHKMLDQASRGLRVCCPGIIDSFDAAKQTEKVRLCLRERVRIKGVLSWEEIKPLVDVPIVIPRAGGYTLTLPVTAGDECLVVFGDSCMDAWWQSGGVQNQMDRRSHDLSDGYAILGVWSQPRVLPGYSISAIQMRNDAGTNLVNLAADALSLAFGANTLVVNAAGVTITVGSNSITVNAAGITINGVACAITGGVAGTVIDSKNFIAHHHNEHDGYATTGVV